jgi:fumarate hydratase class I
MLKGGGSENMSAQYSLPLQRIQADRDFEGVRRCILDAVHQAQGQGCAPGILGVCIGGDRSSGNLIAKKQLFRKLDDMNPLPVLASLEQTILTQANTLGIGPMGLGGRTTLLGVKIGTAGRHPACYFVSVIYSCWATRRYTVELDEKGDITRWL